MIQNTHMQRIHQACTPCERAREIAINCLFSQGTNAEFEYALESGEDCELISIDAANGALRICDAASLDFEGMVIHNVPVRVYMSRCMNSLAYSSQFMNTVIRCLFFCFVIVTGR